MRETDLYPAVKTFLESQGYTVKSEITGADVVALRNDEPPVIVEMKTGFSLTLFHQGIERQKLTESVYLAVPKSTATKAFRRNVALARRLGLGVLTVRLRDCYVEEICDPGPFQPRRSPTKTGRLLREFQRREGDPNLGGGRGGIVTAYRQDSVKIAHYLIENGPQKGATVAQATAVPTATRIMAADHYGWFERVSRGVYGLSDTGAAAVRRDG